MKKGCAQKWAKELAETQGNKTARNIATFYASETFGEAPNQVKNPYSKWFKQAMFWLMKYAPIAALLFCVSLQGCATNPPGESGVPILAFQQVDKDLFRGAAPDRAGLQYLADNGFKTIVNINDDKVSNTLEKEEADGLGIAEYTVPLNGFFAPSTSDMDRIESYLKTAPRPLYVHCQHGHDRTGVAVAIYRIETEGWTYDAARKEMMDLGFHTILIPLNAYFLKRENHL